MPLWQKCLCGVQKGVQVAEEWASGEVTAKDVKAMRKKIYKHRDSLTHKASTDIQQQKEKEVLPTLTETLNAKVLLETFSKMYGLVELQEMNGVKTVSCHKSDHSWINIITHIANKMRKKIVSTIKSAGSWICLTVDESTAFGRSYLILYLRGDVTGEGETENIFWDLIELEEGTTADAIYKALKKSLLEADLDDAYLKSHLICITTDRASVMTGRQSGLITRLKKDYPLLESIHCLAHRLELSVSDALKSVTGCNHFEIFISKLYTLYHQSPKNARQLSEAASQVNICLLKIGHIFTIRWVASSFVTLQAVRRDFPALVAQMKKGAEDGSRSDIERKKFSGLLNRLTCIGFVNDLATIKDVLRELHSLSLKLQKRSTSFMEATREIKMTIEVLKAFKITPGKSMEKAAEAVQVGEFKQVPLRSSKENVNRFLFLQAIINSLSSRMPDTNLTKIITPLDPLNWPKSRESLVLFGEKEIHDLAKMLEVPSREAVEDFRNWKLNNDQNGKVLKKGFSTND
ncbi:E3 SUMO-protein ligase KIAA1586-like [Carassius gibelio]|uniref:E3 SUMO-protein ligase KIAA1586-like n=1 Tax=Carassius gibelio TaxID=101364 RepID=UPI002278E772|nr:E3 SUMO-protein ligase KIAA1586-like [Carassius gibelio]